MYDVGILGGGWAGLLAARMLKEQNPEAKVAIFEKEDLNNMGGLLRSVKKKGFTFDTGGPHILFSKDQQILENITSLLGDNIRKVERKAFVFYEGRYIPYPFENGMFLLEPQTRSEIGNGIIERMVDMARTRDWVPADFEEWIYGFFGQSMANRYMMPYNRKIWKREPSSMDADWVFSPGRLPFPNLKDIIDSVAGIPSTGYKEQAYFFYPAEGGIQSLYDSLLHIVELLGVDIYPSTEVTNIISDRDQWGINNAHNCRLLVNTLPPQVIAPMIFSHEDDRNLTEKFDYNSVVVVGIAIDKEAPYQHAVYVPDPHVVFHRYTWMNNLTTDTPAGKSNLIAEVTVPKWEKINKSTVREKVIEGLFKLHILESRDEILFSEAWVNEFGYPIYLKGHGKLRDKFQLQLKNRGITSVGRWGSWHYWNTDKVYRAVEKEISSII
ncbi:hypothetical protein IX51_09450 [uncultured archaeon]|nr:hypothetical protein IX51_09450 [uncultured archaeon]